MVLGLHFYPYSQMFGMGLYLFPNFLRLSNEGIGLDCSFISFSLYDFIATIEAFRSDFIPAHTFSPQLGLSFYLFFI